jgi:hypothetical protein
MTRRALVVAAVLFAIAAAEVIFAVELVDQGSSVEDRYRVLLTSWLESELWVDLRLLGAGVATFTVAVVLALGVHRERGVRPERG